MDTQKKAALGNITRSMKRLKEKASFVKSLPDGLPGSISAWEYAVNIRIPYDINAIRNTRAMLGSDFEMTQKPRVDSDGDWIATFFRKDDKERDHMVNIFAITSVDGATCRKVQIGTKEVPVYKIECDGETNAK